jgi:hypothetical protein
MEMKLRDEGLITTRSVKGMSEDEGWSVHL